jgi:peptidoglycan/xylan/chitin deacetylase (PgdA/CDA1 family)
VTVGSSIVTRLLYAAAAATGVDAAARRFQTCVPVLCYHNIVQDGLPDGVGDPGLHMALARFIEQMEWLRRHYRVISLNELLTSAGRAVPRGTAVLTFDDGYAGTLAHALPVLDSLDLPATVFVVAGSPGTTTCFWWDDSRVVPRTTSASREHWLTAIQGDGDRIRQAVIRPNDDSEVQPPPELLPASWDVIKAAARSPGVSVGAHSMTHRALPTLEPEALAYELRASRDALHHELGEAPTLFAFPYGAWSPRVRDAAHEAGYAGAVTLDDRPVGPGDDPCALPRINVPARISLPAYRAWLANVRVRRRASSGW